MSHDFLPFNFTDQQGRQHVATTHDDISEVQAFGHGSQGQSVIVLKETVLDVADDVAQAAIMWLEIGS